MTKARVLHIGIAHRNAIKKRTIAIAKGEMKPAPDEPRVWFSSFDSLAKVLSEKNMLLLDTIRNGQPRSLSELAKLSGRQKSNLSRTLHNMERFGLVELKEENQSIKPTVKYDRLLFDFDLGSSEEPKAA